MRRVLRPEGQLYKISCNQSRSVLPSGDADGARLDSSHGCASEAPEVVQVARRRRHSKRQASNKHIRSM